MQAALEVWLPESTGSILTQALSPRRSVHERHLETLLSVSRAIGTILDPQQLIERIMETVTAAFAADRSTLFLHDAKHTELYTTVAQGLGKGQEVRLPDDRGMVGQVFRTHEPLRIPDTYNEPAFAREVALDTGYVPRSMLVVPVGHRPGHCVGVLQVLDRRVNYFEETDLNLLETIAVHVAISLENANLYAAQRRQFGSFVRAFSAALDARDPATQIHSINVANYAQGIGAILGLPPAELEWLRLAGLLHDVGKIGTPEQILLKAGKLTPDETAEMQRHAAYTRKILSQIEFTEEYAGMDFVAAAHHEKLDGTGYPEGLRGEQIPLRVRILAVADIYHALTQDRAYRKGMEGEKALGIIDSMTPHQLDRACVSALKTFLGV